MRERIAIAFICDDNYVMPTLAAITSIIKNKSHDSMLDIFIVTADLSEENIHVFSLFKSDTVNIIIKNETAVHFQSMHNYVDGKQKTRITTTALLKFKFAEIITEYDKLLYLDGDIIVREDLSQLYGTDIANYFCAAVLNTSCLYLDSLNNSMSAYMLVYRRYFNSGVLLLNLDRMRKENSAEILLQAKIDMADAYFMDQDQLNAVFDGHVKLLPIRYNAQYVNLVRAANRFSISALNKIYETNYTTLQDVADDAAIVHYASADKPWLSIGTPLGEEWYKYFLLAKNRYPGIAREYKIHYQPTAYAVPPKVSVIIPTYNVEDYISESIGSVAGQTIKELEIICVDDGSKDSTPDILKTLSENDKRIMVISQCNQGPSAARNVGLTRATGEYVYFLDSDDVLALNALELLYNHAKATNSQNVLFDGGVIYESVSLQRKFAYMSTAYQRKGDYPEVYKGDEIYPLMMENGDYLPVPWLQFFERSYLVENSLKFNTKAIAHQDNLFTIQACLLCPRVTYLKQELYKRRVRQGSIMTSSTGYNHVLGYYTCIIEIVGFLAENRHKLSDAAIVATKNGMNKLLAKVYRDYFDLPRHQRIQPMFPDPYLNVISSLMFFPLQHFDSKRGSSTNILKRTLYHIWYFIRPVIGKSETLTAFAGKIHRRFF